MLLSFASWPPLGCLNRALSRRTRCRSAWPSWNARWPYGRHPSQRVQQDSSEVRHPGQGRVLNGDPFPPVHCQRTLHDAAYTGRAAWRAPPRRQSRLMLCDSLPWSSKIVLVAGSPSDFKRMVRNSYPSSRRKRQHPFFWKCCLGALRWHLDCRVARITIPACPSEPRKQ